MKMLLNYGTPAALTVFFIFFFFVGLGYLKSLLKK